MPFKNMPKLVSPKRNIIFLVGGGLLILVLIIVHNIVDNKANHSNNSVNQTAPPNAADAIAQEATYGPERASSKPMATKPVTITTPSSVATAPALAGNQSNPSTPVTTPLNSETAQKYQEAMSAPINSNQLSGNSILASGGTAAASANPSSSSPNNAGVNPQDQNMQAEKTAFLQANTATNNIYLNEMVQVPITKLELQAGTIIPGVIITGIDSDLPGQITAQVRENVYDSISGKYLLIPQGSKLIGVYDSNVAYGQSRVLIAWNRIIFPDGDSISLEGMPGVDLSGYAGFHDQVNNHYFKIFTSVLLLSVLGAGAQISQPNWNNNEESNSNPTVSQVIAGSVGTNVANVGSEIVEKDINIQPTLVIRPGYEFNITVTKDMVFTKAYDEALS